jgi:hypothetical protein
VLIEEARWIRGQLASCQDSEIFPFVNVGSSTGAFRALTQPHVDAEIFTPLAERGGTVWHVDIKEAPGVDLVGDLENPEFVAKIRRDFAPQCVLVSNLLEHVSQPERVADSVLAAVPVGGLIIVSGPRVYPYHPDPIDTRFRPSLGEVQRLFPGTRLMAGDIIPSSTWTPWGGRGNGSRVRATKYLARIAVPVYRPRAWRRRLDAIPYIFSGVSAYAAVLTKESERRA